MRLKIVLTETFPILRNEFFTWCDKTTSLGLRRMSQVEVIITGIMMRHVVIKVQNKVAGKKNQTNTSNAINAAGTRLRRILSNIFQRESADSGFLCQCLLASGMNGRNQENICQSPRPQRARLFISAR